MKPVLERVAVRGFPRIHLTLIDLASITFRRFGGAGFSIDTLPVLVDCNIAAGNKVTPEGELEPRDEADVMALLDRLAATLQKKFCARLISLPPAHVGFGSKTALLLAVAAGCNALLGRPLKEEELKRISGRGGASGIGINAFFDGGFIVDVGHPRSGEVKFVPSSAVQSVVTPQMSVRISFPKEWKVHLFLPRGHRYSGGEEIAFFEHNTPIPGEDVFRTLAAVYHGVVPAFLDHDLYLLKQAVADVHATGFKQREVENQDEEVRYVLELLNKSDHVVAGMSSMGPLIYAITSADLPMSVQDIIIARGVTYLGACHGRNVGHEMIEDL